MITLIFGQKGGTGKTTLATTLAAMRAQAGRDVLLVDTDLQASAAYWAAVRADKSLPRVACVQCFGKTLAAEVLDLANRYDDVIVDAGGRDSIEMRYALSVAERAISPVAPSQLDLWTVDAAADLVRQAQAINPDLRASLVLARAPTAWQSRDADDAAALLADYRTVLDLAPVVIKDRIAYRRAAAGGACVFEQAGDKHAQAEARALYAVVFGEQ